jgi:hypothetical protein
VLAGSIPTEFGKLINLNRLKLYSNKLTGTPRLFISPGVVGFGKIIAFSAGRRVYHLV